MTTWLTVRTRLRSIRGNVAAESPWPSVCRAQREAVRPTRKRLIKNTAKAREAHKRRADWL